MSIYRKDLKSLVSCKKRIVLSFILSFLGTLITWNVTASARLCSKWLSSSESVDFSATFVPRVLLKSLETNVDFSATFVPRALLKSLETNSDVNVRLEIMMTLGERESLDFNEFDQNRLVDILYSQEHLIVKNEVAQVLGKVKLLSETTLLRISELLIDQRDGFRSVGVRALKQIKLSDGEVLMYIVPLSKDRAASTRLAALKVLRSTELSDPSIFYKDLIDRLKDSDPDVRALSMKIIGEINPPKKGIHRKLVASLADPNPVVRDKTIRTLGIIQPKDPTTLFSIANLLMHRNMLVRIAAVDALVEVNLNNKSVLTFIASTLIFGDTWTSNQQNNNSRKRDETFGYRLSAAKVLRQIGPRDKEVQLLWVRGLGDSRSRVRTEVEHGLEELRPSDPEVLEMIFDYDPLLYGRIIDQTPQEVSFGPLNFDL